MNHGTRPLSGHTALFSMVNDRGNEIVMNHNIKRSVDHFILLDIGLVCKNAFLCVYGLGVKGGGGEGVWERLIFLELRVCQSLRPLPTYIIIFVLFIYRSIFVATKN